MVVFVELKESGTVGTGEMVSEWWCLVSWKRVGQLWQEKWWVNGGVWWAEREWDMWGRRNREWMVVSSELKDSGTVVTGGMVSEWWCLVSWKRVGHVGQEKWWVNGGELWAERQWDRWDGRNGEWMVVSGKLKESGTDGTGEVVSEWWWVVIWKGVGQLGQEKWWVNACEWNAEREWNGWDKRNGLDKLKINTISVGKRYSYRHFGRPSTRWDIKDNLMNWTWRITFRVAFP